MAEWSKALVLGTSHFDGVGSNPTAANFFSPFIKFFTKYILLKMLPRHRGNDYAVKTDASVETCFQIFKKSYFVLKIAVNLLSLRLLQTIVRCSEMGLSGNFLQSKTNVPLTHL